MSIFNIFKKEEEFIYHPWKRYYRCNDCHAIVRIYNEEDPYCISCGSNSGSFRDVLLRDVCVGAGYYKFKQLKDNDKIYGVNVGLYQTEIIKKDRIENNGL